MSEAKWPGESLCVHYPATAYAAQPFASELGLTQSQALQFENLRQHDGLEEQHRRRQILTATQNERLAAFERAVQITSEAIELGLIAAPAKGEILCH